MNKSIIVILALVSVCLFSCIKNRIPLVVGNVTIPKTDTLLYYWDFNNGDSSNHNATFCISPHATYLYACSYTDYSTGTNLNLQGINDSAGFCLRVRNPSDSIIFYMPTMGYDSISLSYAEQPSSLTSAPLINSLSYTTDGINYINPITYTIADTTFDFHSFSFATDPNCSNNAKFAVKIKFLNNNTGTKGNNRFDNFALFGVRR